MDANSPIRTGERWYAVDWSRLAMTLFLGGFVAFLAAVVFLPTLGGPGHADVRRMTMSATHMKTLLTALQMYESKHGRFPPAVFTKNGHKHTWRVLMLPYLDEGDLYKEYRFDEAWNSPHNARVTRKPIAIFQSPATNPVPRRPITNFVVVKGAETVFPMGEISRISTSDIRDGSLNTVALVEIADSDVHWAEPRDLEFSKLDFTINGPRPGSISSDAVGRGAHVGSVVGLVRFLSNDTPPHLVRALLTRDGHEEISPDF